MKTRLLPPGLLLGVAPPLVGQEEKPDTASGAVRAAVTVGIERYRAGADGLTAVVLRGRKLVEGGGVAVELAVAVPPELLGHGVLPLGLDLNLLPAVRSDRPFLAFTGGGSPDFDFDQSIPDDLDP